MDLDALGRTPDAFQAALTTLGPRRFVQQPATGEWSPAEILTHVRAADAVIAPRIMQVLVRPGVALTAFDEREVGVRLARAQIAAVHAIAVFKARRTELVALLATVTDEERRLHGNHEAKGAVTIADLYNHLAQHEREHLAQLETAVMNLSSS